MFCKALVSKKSPAAFLELPKYSNFVKAAVAGGEGGIGLRPIMFGLNREQGEGLIHGYG